MPCNQITINNGIEYYVGDSKMEELLSWLNQNGVKQGVEDDIGSESDTKAE